MRSGSDSSKGSPLQINELLAPVSIGLQLQNNLKLTRFKPFVAGSKLYDPLKHAKLP